MEEEENIEKEPKKKKKVPYVIILVAVLVIIFAGTYYMGDGRIRISVESWLERIVKKNDLQTVTYTYNAIVKQCKNDKCTEKSSNDDYKYFVSYEGTVTAGIILKKVDIDVDRANKKIIMTLPEATITGYNVPIGKLDFIFMKGKYNKSQELEAAHKLCKADLEERSSKDKLILETAKKNAAIVLKEFYKPLIDRKYPKYDLEIK